MSNNISINYYRINLENEELLAQACLGGWCRHGSEDRCARTIVTEGWHDCVEEKRLLTVREYMCMAPSLAEEFIKSAGENENENADKLRAKVMELKLSDSLGILTMFAFIIGDPADDSLRGEFYEFLNDEDDEVGPMINESNFFDEMEKSMKTFVDIKRAEKAWASRTTANAGPDCDQCGNARTGIGGRVCNMCDLAKQDPAIVHNHVICHCCAVDWEDAESVDYDDGNQPPRWKDVARRSHDDGFDDEYDGPDEETDLQAADRRQEMAENMERQMEAEYELNHAVFEHKYNSTPTDGISRLSPIMPDN